MRRCWCRCWFRWELGLAALHRLPLGARLNAWQGLVAEHARMHLLATTAFVLLFLLVLALLSGLRVFWLNERTREKVCVREAAHIGTVVMAV